MKMLGATQDSKPVRWPTLGIVRRERAPCVTCRGVAINSVAGPERSGLEVY